MKIFFFLSHLLIIVDMLLIAISALLSFTTYLPVDDDACSSYFSATGRIIAILSN